MKKIVSILLAFVLLLGMLPMTVMSAEAGSDARATYSRGDIDCDGDVDVDDVLALLWHVLFPDDYPIEPEPTEPEPTEPEPTEPEPTEPNVPTYTVIFVDYDGTAIATQNVKAGKDAEAPESPTKSGAVFLGWCGNYANVTKDETVRAVYDDENNVIVAHSGFGKAGDSITVLFEITGEVKTCGFDFAFFYDPNLQIVSYDDDLDLDVVINESAYENGALLNFSSSSDKTKQRDIIEVTFKISESASGILPIELVMNSIKELDTMDKYVDADYVLVNGFVTVE